MGIKKEEKKYNGKIQLKKNKLGGKYILIAISDSLICDQALSDNDVMTYCFLKMQTYSENYESTIFYINELAYQMYGDADVSNSVKDAISDSLEYLIKRDYIVARKSGGKRIIDMSTFQMDVEGPYVLLDGKDLKLVVASVKRGKASILRFYLLLLSSIYTKKKTGTNDQEWFAKILRISTQTVSDYMKKLEKLKLIVVYRSGIQYVSNTYGRYEDKDRIEAEGKRRAHGYHASEASNNNRRYMARFRNALAGKQYTKEQLEDIYQHVKARNDRIVELGDTRLEIVDLQPLLDKINSKGV